MGSSDNIMGVTTLSPDYLGFIFVESSLRNFKTTIPKISNSIKKTGVFVNETFEFVREKIIKHQLEAVQLHGTESYSFCEKIKELEVEVIKVFSVKDTFDFSVLTPYESVVNYFLFDTKGKLAGGNGVTFDWNVLHKYSSSVPFFLSGGIGLEEIDAIKTLLQLDLPMYGLDLNSKFEDAPAEKNIDKLSDFLIKLNTHE
ncbi:MAG: phosphoribosylanthranilate isomerase [Flavicella sp.]